MPNFLLIGVAKSGTTSVYAYLAQHPQIFMSSVKEPDFFEFGEAEQTPLNFPGRHWAIQTSADYQALFQDVDRQRAIGEASTSNIEARSCQRIQHYLPDGKFICILRQPVDRSYSAFLMQRLRGNEPEKDFVTAYSDSTRRWKQRFETRLPHYLDAGWYVSRIQDWLTRFSQDQIYIGLYDDLLTNPATFMQTLYVFLDVDSEFVPNVSIVYNRGAGTRSSLIVRLLTHNMRLKPLIKLIAPQPMRKKAAQFLRNWNQTPVPTLNPQVRKALTLPQRDDILRLQDLIGRDLTHWLVE